MPQPLVKIVLDDVEESIECDEGDVKVRVEKQNQNGKKGNIKVQ